MRTAIKNFPKEINNVFAINEGRSNEPLWIEKPVSFKEFVESKLFCNHPSLSKNMYKEADRLLGKDPTKIFSIDKIARELLLLAGKGSGKSLMGYLVEMYLMYCCCCLREPVTYFKLASTSFIDFVNVARSWEQGITTYFSRMRNQFKDNLWFIERFNMAEEGKVLSTADKKWGSIKILKDRIEISPQNLRAINYHSQAESFEGATILFFIYDEISGHISEKEQKQADRTLKSLRSSVRELPYIGIVASYPRLDMDNDFLCKLQKIEVDNKRILGATYATFELKPKRFYCGKTFKFITNTKTGESRRIPIECEKDFIVPEEGKAKILAMPVAIGERYVDFYFDETSKTIREPAIQVKERLEWSPEAQKHYIIKEIEKVNLHHPVIVTLDQGKVESACALTIAHREEKKVVIDGIVLWDPTPKDERIPTKKIVDLQNVIDFILDLSNYTRIIKVRFDHWNTAVLERNLRTKGIQTEQKGADGKAYANMRSVLQAGLFEFTLQPETNELIGQIKLLAPRGDRKPLVMAGKQDLVDTLALMADEFYEEGGITTELPTGQVIERMGGTQMADLTETRQVESLVALRTFIEKKTIRPRPARDSELPTGVVISHGR